MFTIKNSKGKKGYVKAVFTGADGKELFSTADVKGKAEALRPNITAIAEAFRGQKHINTLKNTLAVVDETSKKVDDKHTTWSV